MEVAAVPSRRSSLAFSPPPPSPPASSSPLRPPTPRDKTKDKTVKAKIALGDKRPVKAKAPPPRRRPRPRSPSVHEHRRRADHRQPRVVRAAILCLHNQIRAGGPAAAQGQREAAQGRLGHSDDMVNEGYFDHTARTATRSSTASSTPATPSATTAGRSARTSPGAPATSAPPRAS